MTMRSRTEPGDATVCAICGRTLTDLEVERLAADIDFVEHHGHLIRVEKLGAYPVTCPVCRGTGGGVYNDCPACDGNGVV